MNNNHIHALDFIYFLLNETSPFFHPQDFPWCDKAKPSFDRLNSILTEDSKDSFAGSPSSLKIKLQRNKYFIDILKSMMEWVSDEHTFADLGLFGMSEVLHLKLADQGVRVKSTFRFGSWSLKPDVIQRGREWKKLAQKFGGKPKVFNPEDYTKVAIDFGRYGMKSFFDFFGNDDNSKKAILKRSLLNLRKMAGGHSMTIAESQSKWFKNATYMDMDESIFHDLLDVAIRTRGCKKSPYVKILLNASKDHPSLLEPAARLLVACSRNHSGLIKELCGSKKQFELLESHIIKAISVMTDKEKSKYENLILGIDTIERSESKVRRKI